MKEKDKARVRTEPDAAGGLRLAAGFADVLITTLEDDYPRLHARLTLYLGSSDAAADALHDTYVKLRSGPAISELRYPHGYLYRMAINLAANNRRKNMRVTMVGPDALEALPDPDPGPERVIAALQEVHRAVAALHTLPDKAEGYSWLAGATT